MSSYVYSQVMRLWSYLQRRVGQSPDDHQVDNRLEKQEIGLNQQFTESEMWRLLTRLTDKTFWLTWVVDPSSRFYYRWLLVMSAVTLYNLVTIIARSVFWQIQENQFIVWIVLDYLSDFFYIIDVFIQFRTSYLDQGILVSDVHELRLHYMQSVQFKLAVVSLLPTDIVYAVVGFRYVIVRLNRLLRCGRLTEAISRIQSITTYPNVFRVATLVFYILLSIHWNACFYFQISVWAGLGSDSWVYSGSNGDIMLDYSSCFYWSTMMLTTIAEMPKPVQDYQFVIMTSLYLIGILVIASILGNVGNAISKVKADRSEFQQRRDAVKRCMAFHKLSDDLESKVIKWFDYLWNNSQSMDSDSVLEELPGSFQLEICMNVHEDTLKRVAIFQECERGLLAQLVLKLRLVVFGPGDYICRKGDIGKEMYILKKGKLAVVADDGQTVFATLQEGTVFGEISLLNIAGNKNGNRRTANIRSIGYTDLFMLSKENLWEALREYPDARTSLLEKGRQLLRKDNLLDEEVVRKEEMKTYCTVEEKLSVVDDKMDTVKTNLARLMGEYCSINKKLQDRVQNLEIQLGKYDQLLLSATRRVSIDSQNQSLEQNLS